MYKYKSAKKLALTTFSILFVVLLLSAVMLTLNKHRARSANNKSTAGSAPQINQTNYNPPTKQDESAVDKHKDQLSTGTPQDQKTQTVTPVITNVSESNGQIITRAFVPGISEDGGICSFVFSNETKVQTVTTNASVDATVTRCANASVPKSELATGIWTVTVKYSSADANGSSQKASFEVK